MSVLSVPEMPFPLSDTLVRVYHATAVLSAVYAGLCVTGLWIYYAEDISTGIRLADLETEDTDDQS